MPLPPDFPKRLWDAADQLWTNSTLQPSQYSTPVLALIFLKYADHRFAAAEKKYEAALEAVYEHVYESYWGDGKSKYVEAAAT
jgi:type I restriction-modification system DNA methylase subunit